MKKYIEPLVQITYTQIADIITASTSAQDSQNQFDDVIKFEDLFR